MNLRMHPALDPRVVAREGAILLALFAAVAAVLWVSQEAPGPWWIVPAIIAAAAVLSAANKSLLPTILVTALSVALGASLSTWEAILPPIALLLIYFHGVYSAAQLQGRPRVQKVRT